MRVLTALVAVLVAVIAVVSGMSVGGGDKRLVVLPLALVVAATLSILACTASPPSSCSLLGVRASIDLFKLSGCLGGNTHQHRCSARPDPSNNLGPLPARGRALALPRSTKDGHLRGSRLRLALVAFSATGVVGIVGSSQPSVSALPSLRIPAVVLMYVVLEQLIVDRAVIERVLVACYARWLPARLHGVRLPGRPSGSRRQGQLHPDHGPVQPVDDVRPLPGLHDRVRVRRLRRA